MICIVNDLHCKIHHMEPQKQTESEQSPNAPIVQQTITNTVMPNANEQNHASLADSYMYQESEKEYALVPWYRKTGWVLLLYLVFSLGAALILLTGDVYAQDPKTKITVKWTKKIRIMLGIAGVVGFTLVVLHLLGK